MSIEIQITIDKNQKCPHCKKSIESFGICSDYHNEDIVVWQGSKPCIGKINIGKSPRVGRDYYISDGHNSLSYENLRLANREEIELYAKFEEEVIFVNFSKDKK